ncbi:MAG: hypothetical protein JSW15_05255, partial [Deltaproteobacteria bacterium]
EVGDLYIYFTDGGKLIRTHWEGHPEDIIEEMFQKVQDYEANRGRWVQELREIKRDKKDCLYCEYSANLCKGENS